MIGRGADAVGSPAESSQDFPKQKNSAGGASADLTEESAYPLIFPSQTQPA